MRMPKPPSLTTVIYAVIAIFVVNGSISAIVHARKPLVKRTVCLSNIKRMATGQIIYAEDHDGRLPLSETWLDAITAAHPANSDTRFCDELKDREPNQFGYAMYFKRSGQKVADFEVPGQTVVLFESVVLDRNATTGLVGFGRRHQAVPFGFADGSAKCLGYRHGPDLQKAIDINLAIP